MSDNPACTIQAVDNRSDTLPHSPQQYFLLYQSMLLWWILLQSQRPVSISFDFSLSTVKLVFDFVIRPCNARDYTSRNQPFVFLMRQYPFVLAEQQWVLCFLLQWNIRILW